MRGIVTLLLALIVGVVGYEIGVAQGVATTGTAAPAVYYPHFFFGGFGFLFPLLFIFLLFALLRGAFWGGWGRGYGGPGHSYWGDPQARYEEWHRRQHGEAPRQDGGPSASPPTGR